MLDEQGAETHKIQLHAGQILQLELDKRKMSQGDLAQELGVARQTINLVVKGHQKVSRNLSKKLGVFFDYPEDHWYDLDRRRRRLTLVRVRISRSDKMGL